MKKKWWTSRAFRYALAGSIAIHLAFAALVRPQVVRARVEPGPTRLIIVNEPLKPTPTPRPVHVRHVVPQRARQSIQPRIHPPHFPPSHSGPPVVVAPSAGPTSVRQTGTVGGNGTLPSAVPSSLPATPSPTPKPSCSSPDVLARAVDTVSPDVPEDAAQGFTGDVQVKVDLNAQGSVIGASIYRSSGFFAYDRAAIQAATSSRYAPEERDCRAVPGSYLFNVEYTSN